MTTNRWTVLRCGILALGLLACSKLQAAEPIGEGVASEERAARVEKLLAGFCEKACCSLESDLRNAITRSGDEAEILGELVRQIEEKLATGDPRFVVPGGCGPLVCAAKTGTSRVIERLRLQRTFREALLRYHDGDSTEDWQRVRILRTLLESFVDLDAVLRNRIHGAMTALPRASNPREITDLVHYLPIEEAAAALTLAEEALISELGGQELSPIEAVRRGQGGMLQRLYNARAVRHVVDRHRRLRERAQAEGPGPLVDEWLHDHGRDNTTRVRVLFLLHELGLEATAISIARMRLQEAEGRVRCALLDLFDQLGQRLSNEEVVEFGKNRRWTWH